MSTALASGLHGKLPARGDFVTRNLPRTFVEPWDEWLQAGMAASREQLGDGWLAIYLQSPIWSFALAPGLCGPDTWMGVVLPSVDKVGRYFPLTIAAALGTAARPLLAAACASEWFGAAQDLALRALDDDRLDLEAFVNDLGALPGIPAVIDDGTAASRCVALDASGSLAGAVATLLDRVLRERDAPYSLWWTDGGAEIAPHCCLVESLPPADRFVHLLAGDGPRAGDAPTPS